MGLAIVLAIAGPVLVRAQLGLPWWTLPLGMIILALAVLDFLLRAVHDTWRRWRAARRQVLAEVNRRERMPGNGAGGDNRA